MAVLARAALAGGMGVIEELRVRIRVVHVARGIMLPIDARRRARERRGQNAAALRQRRLAFDRRAGVRRQGFELLAAPAGEVGRHAHRRVAAMVCAAQGASSRIAA